MTGSFATGRWQSSATEQDIYQHIYQCIIKTCSNTFSKTFINTFSSTFINTFSNIFIKTCINTFIRKCVDKNDKHDDKKHHPCSWKASSNPIGTDPAQQPEEFGLIKCWYKTNRQRKRRPLSLKVAGQLWQINVLMEVKQNPKHDPEGFKRSFFYNIHFQHTIPSYICTLHFQLTIATYIFNLHFQPTFSSHSSNLYFPLTFPGFGECVTHDHWRLIGFVYHSTLGLRVIKKRRRTNVALKSAISCPQGGSYPDMFDRRRSPGMAGFVKSEPGLSQQVPEPHTPNPKPSTLEPETNPSTSQVIPEPQTLIPKA